MAAFTANSLTLTIGVNTINECENAAGSVYILDDDFVTFAKVDGGDAIIQTITIPIIRRTFDSGFQY